MMTKVATKDHAESIALRMALSHGMSVFDGAFYVGTRAELLAIGCVNITSWKDLSETMFHRREGSRQKAEGGAS